MPDYHDSAQRAREIDVFSILILDNITMSLFMLIPVWNQADKGNSARGRICDPVRRDPSGETVTEERRSPHLTFTLYFITKVHL